MMTTPMMKSMVMRPVASGDTYIVVRLQAQQICLNCFDALCGHSDYIEVYVISPIMRVLSPYLN